eukprot:5460546-Ditylum_brightwellii.AAC.1
MVMIETLKRRELHGLTQKIKLHGYNIVKGGQHHIMLGLKMRSRVATSSMKYCSRLSDHLHHAFMKGHLNEPSDKCFRVPELDETKCLQCDNEMPGQLDTCMLGETEALVNEETVKHEGVTFMEQQAKHKFGIDNCTTGHVCKDK